MLSLRQQALKGMLRPMPLRAVQIISPRLMTCRMTSTQSTTSEQAYEVLKAQRKRRPLSPDLQIYQPQLTWYLSGLHRVTGLSLAFPYYGFLLAYLAAPAVGLGFDSAALVDVAASLPLIVKLPLKFVAALPFTFHAFNGVRHLIWDTANQLTIKGVYRTGYIVEGLTVVSALILALL